MTYQNEGQTGEMSEEKPKVTPWKFDPKCKLFIRLPKSDFDDVQPDVLENAFREILQEAAMYDEFVPALKKGYCFLIFRTRLSAALAHDMLFQKEILGCILNPSFSFTKDEMMAVSAGVKDEEIERNHRTVVVKGISDSTTDEQLNAFFSQYGIVKSAKVIRRKITLAFVVFQKHYPAFLAVQRANGTELNGSIMELAVSENKNIKRRALKFQSGGGPGRGGYGGGWGGGGGYGGGWRGRGRGKGGSWGGRGRGSWGGNSGWGGGGGGNNNWGGDSGNDWSGGDFGGGKGWGGRGRGGKGWGGRGGGDSGKGWGGRGGGGKGWGSRGGGGGKGWGSRGGSGGKGWGSRGGGDSGGWAGGSSGGDWGSGSGSSGGGWGNSSGRGGGGGSSGWGGNSGGSGGWGGRGGGNNWGGRGGRGGPRKWKPY